MPDDLTQDDPGVISRAFRIYWTYDEIWPEIFNCFFLLMRLFYMDVSENSGTPKSSILIGFSIINHPFWRTPIFGNTHIFMFTLAMQFCQNNRNVVDYYSMVLTLDSVWYAPTLMPPWNPWGLADIGGLGKRWCKGRRRLVDGHPKSMGVCF